MAVIDHLVVAVASLESGCDWFESELGVRPTYGGAHQGRGTHNALVSVGDAYIELIAADPNQPEPDGPRPFGVAPGVDRCLVTFAVRADPERGETIEDLIERCRAVGHDPGPAVAMDRLTPSGDRIAWRLTFPTGRADGFIPFLLDWGDTTHPSTTAPGGLRLVDLMGSTPFADEANAVLEALGLEAMAVVGDGGLSAILAGPEGRTLVL